MDEKTINQINQINQALSTTLVAFQNINAPMTMKNIQFGSIVVNNIQNISQVLKTFQEQSKNQNDKVSEDNDKV